MTRSVFFFGIEYKYSPTKQKGQYYHAAGFWQKYGGINGNERRPKFKLLSKLNLTSILPYLDVDGQWDTYPFKRLFRGVLGLGLTLSDAMMLH